MDFSPEIPQSTTMGTSKAYDSNDVKINSISPDSRSSSDSGTQTLVPPSTPGALKVDFSWRHFQSLISNAETNEPVYKVDTKSLMAPHLTFKRTNGTSEDAIVGTGSINCFSINAKFQISGGPSTKLKAMKRFKTHYSFPSHAFSHTAGVKSGKIEAINTLPTTTASSTTETMTWTANCGMKTWDFVCTDPRGRAVGKFAANIWACKKLGTFEFMPGSSGHAGPDADSTTITDAQRDELVVTGLTLFYCMMVRCNSLPSFFAALFARPGHSSKVKDKDLDDDDSADDGVVR